MMFELTSLHMFYWRQLSLRDIVLIHVEENIFNHDDTHLLITPGSVKFNKEGIVVSAQDSVRNRAE